MLLVVAELIWVLIGDIVLHADNMHITTIPRVVHRAKYALKGALVGKVIGACVLVTLYWRVGKVVVTNSLEEYKVAILITHSVTHRLEVLITDMLTLGVDYIAQSNTIARKALRIYILANIGHSLCLKALYMELALRLRVCNHQQSEGLLLCRILSKCKVISFHTLYYLLIEVRMAILHIYLVCRRYRVEYMHRICRGIELVVTLGICSHTAKAVANGHASNTIAISICKPTRNLNLCRGGNGNNHKGNKRDQSFHSLSF